MRTSIAVLLLMWLGCGSPPPAPKKTEAPKQESPHAKEAASKVNLDEIFPPGRGRELVLNNCTTCHTFVPIVILRMSKEAWQRNSRDHRGRVTALSNADFQVLYEYLAANFNPDKPVPKLPNELMETWTSY
ncbi:MAG: hypothetical protein U0Q16_12050 [Bryobacteraceae bacterium]